MGLFRSSQAKPSKPGSYEFAWPAASGLGQRSYHEEAETRSDYLVYSSKRRIDEGWAPEDIDSMQAAVLVLSQLDCAEFLVVTGTVDILFLNEAGGKEFRCEAAITNRSTILWWQGRETYQDQYAALRHPDLQPRFTEGLGYHFHWSEGGLGIFPLPGVEPIRSLGFEIKPHFSNDGHANRRGASVQATLQSIRGDS